MGMMAKIIKSLRGPQADLGKGSVRDGDQLAFFLPAVQMAFGLDRAELVSSRQSGEPAAGHIRSVKILRGKIHTTDMSAATCIWISCKRADVLNTACRTT